MFNEKTQNYIKNSKNYNFSVKGIINEKLKFYNTTSSNFEKIDFNNINMFLKKHRITDILVSDRNSYKKKIYYFKKFLKFNVRVVFLDDVYNYINLDNNLLKFKPNLDEVISESLETYHGEKQIFKNIHNKKILVTGGAGSIGSMLVERLINYKPKKIIVVDKDEYSIFNLKKI